jgi:hypothetical protein
MDKSSHVNFFLFSDCSESRSRTISWHDLNRNQGTIPGGTLNVAARQDGRESVPSRRVFAAIGRIIPGHSRVQCPPLRHSPEPAILAT